ncbi:MAG: hypothetical protein J6S05_05550 [Bacteroidaceae bacterium]|nr:hypothetical protein [Bacteroidaceae bacterium]
MEKKKMKNYVKQLKEFKNYMEACFTVLMEHGNGDNVSEFYSSDFEITFRGKKVTVGNGAEVFQAIEELIQTEIDNEEEI